MTETGGEVEVTKKRTKRLTKVLDGSFLSITEGETGTTLTFDFLKLPKGMQTTLCTFGLGNKIGDSATGKKGYAAVDAMNKMWDRLMENEWSIRPPAVKKITQDALQSKFDALPERTPAEKAAKKMAKAMLTEYLK